MELAQDGRLASPVTLRAGCPDCPLSPPPPPQSALGVFPSSSRSSGASPLLGPRDPGAPAWGGCMQSRSFTHLWPLSIWDSGVEVQGGFALPWAGGPGVHLPFPLATWHWYWGPWHLSTSCCP